MVDRHALVVDDSRSARYAMRKYLERYRYDVATAEDAREALGYLREHKPLVIFLDYLMPGTNGLEVLRAIKSDPTTVGIPVVICTSVDRPEFKQQARWSGALEVLQKPPSLERLQHLLEGLERAAPPTPAPQVATASPNVVPLPLPESAQRYALLRGEIDSGLRTLTEEVFVQLSELKAQVGQVEQAGMSREDHEAFRRIAREEAEALTGTMHREIALIRQRLDAMEQLQRQDREELLAAARSVAASEAQHIATHTMRESVARLSHSLSDAVARALGHH